MVKENELLEGVGLGGNEISENEDLDSFAKHTMELLSEFGGNDEW
jgi:hypothetical protein